MSYLMLYGSGWTQRWRVAAEEEAQIGAAIARVGKDETSTLTVLDPGSDAPALLVVHWAQVATAVLLDSGPEPTHDREPGQYP